MKTLILSGFDDAMAEVGIRCTATHRAYAARWGYDHEVVREYEPGTHPSWQKIRLLKERIDSYDRIMWLDADSLITNPTKPIDWVVNAAMCISTDWCAPVDAELDTTYVSCGNFILQDVQDVHRFLDIWASHDRYASRKVCCWEQDALRAAMQADKWFNDQVVRFPRRMFNAVHQSCVNGNFPNGAPEPWQPGDFLIHLTNVDRLPLIDQHNLEGIRQNVPFVPDWWEQVMCADYRHVSWLYDVLKAVKPQRTLEVGVWSGTTSSVFIAADVPEPHFCDISFRSDFRKVATRGVLHQKEGRHVIPMHQWDLAFVDGNHALDAVEPEANALLDSPPRIIVAHDVTATVAGFGHCEGAALLWHRLQQEGWMCVVDSKVRHNERTDRGMLMATRDPELFEQITRAYRANCW